MAKLSTWIKNNPFTNKFYGIKSRNEGAFLAFNSQWFEKYQTLLLIALNMPIFSILVRYMMRLHENNVFVPICRITPSNVIYWTGRNKRVLVAYTHVKFSKRVYFSLRWLWWALHYIDEALNYFIIPKELSFGFDTLTAYPDANPEISTWDGCVYRFVAGESFATIVAGSGNGGDDSRTDDESGAVTDLWNSGASADMFRWLTRSIYLFSTNIGSSATISTATLSLYPTAQSTGLGTPSYHIVAATTSSNTGKTNSDYQNIGTTSFAEKSHANFNTGGYRDFTLNSSGISNINKTGISKFGRRTSWDLNGSFTGTWSASGASGTMCFAADETGTTKDPKLVIEYNTGSIKSHIGTAAASVKSHIGTASADVKKHIGTT